MLIGRRVLALALVATAIGFPAATPSHASVRSRLVQGPASYAWPRGSAHRPAAATTGGQLTYGGGGQGTISTSPGVYVVFWGSQWSKADPYADYLTRFVSGLYGPGDDWSSTTFQYCEGVPAGSVSCPADATHVGPAQGSLLKGVWFDDSQAAVPFTPIVNETDVDQMAAEAVRAAAHFGNTTAGANANAQYLIALPSTYGIEANLIACAYHSQVASSYGALAYINLPYQTDLGSQCGQNDVNPGPSGTYDGVSIVAGHEILEAMTDMPLHVGWLDAGGSENGDKCEWLTTGPGAMANLTLSTGTFAVQSTWSNAANGGTGGCVLHNS